METKDMIQLCSFVFPSGRYCALTKHYDEEHVPSLSKKPPRRAPKYPVGTRCAICDRTKRLVYDHDHQTGKFRGWLCYACNSGLGHLGDNIQGLKNALAYLEKHQRISDSSESQ